MRIAIVRLTSLGDVIHTLPVAHALRRQCPNAYIVWIVEEREQTLLVNNPAVDEVVVGPSRRWRREFRTPTGAIRVLKEWRALRERLRSLKLDVAIDVQGLLKSTLFTVLTRAPVRIGFAWGHAREPLSSLFTTHRVIPPPDAVHMVHKNLSLLEPLGVTGEPIAFPLPANPEAEQRAEALLWAQGVRPQSRVVGFLPTTRRRVKQWPPAYYRQLAERLTKQNGVYVLLVGAPSEKHLLRCIGGGLDGRHILIIVPPLAELAAFLQRMTLAVGNDTGPLHLAAALGVPTIGLYGPTRPEKNGPYGLQIRTIQSPTRSMREINVDTVFQAVMAWLA